MVTRPQRQNKIPQVISKNVTPNYSFHPTLIWPVSSATNTFREAKNLKIKKNPTLHAKINPIQWFVAGDIFINLHWTYHCVL